MARAAAALAVAATAAVAGAAAPGAWRRHGAVAAVRGPPPARDCALPNARPPPSARLFTSPAVEAAIASLVPNFKDPNLAALFANTLPNTLDTTVYAHTPPGNGSAGDTFVVTGDIPAMWLRDSTNQVLPYLRFVANDTALRGLVAGVIARQARCVLLDPYANAFQLSAAAGPGPHADDSTTRPAFAGTTIDAMTPDIFERKWEVDSLANVLRLSALYFNATGGDTTPYTPAWLAAVDLILDTFTAQQLDTEEEDATPNGAPYVFQRTTGEPSDTLEHGRGAPAKRTGMIKSGFRGSDDALLLPFSIPENAFAAASLRAVAGTLRALGQAARASAADLLAAEVEAGIAAHGIYTHPTTGAEIYAYEVDGFGNFMFMDDANIPGLLSLPYYGFTSVADPLYAATRAAVLSTVNPYFICGSTGCGIGGPHNGWYWVWPMALVSQAWTSTDDGEIADVLARLVAASACTGLTHESFDRNSYGSYTRPWFAWANSLTADLILKVAAERPYLIFK
jgi:uncharacterized protein